MAYETDNRLKSYLDTNQLQREQLCLAVLSTDRRFSDVRPRHPRGGPDGGRDIEAVFRGDQRAFAAVGFVNQADDSSDKKARITKKFREDVAGAIEGVPRPDVFVFITNLNLTVGEKDSLCAFAIERGFTYCDVFDRERLRIVLDSPDGFSIRFQFLGIPLSEAEQSTFFAKWGNDIQSVISTGFQEVHETLDRVLFLQESGNPMTQLAVRLELDRTYSGEEIGHFRAFCSMYLREPRQEIMSILFGSSDKADRIRWDAPPERKDDAPGIKHGVSGGQWEQRVVLANSSAGRERHGGDEEVERLTMVSSSSAIGRDEVASITIVYNKNSLIRWPPILALRDIDEAMFLPIVNHSLATKVARIEVVAGGYKLLEIGSDKFSIDTKPFEPSIPAEFSEDELRDPWVRIRPAGSSSFRVDFFSHTPKRLFAPRRCEDKSSDGQDSAAPSWKLD